MSKWIYIVLFGLFLILLPSLVRAQEQMYFFYGQGCPHCAVVEEYFEENDVYSEFDIQGYEIYNDPDNAALYNELLDERSHPATRRGVPTLVSGDMVIVGDKPIIDYIQGLESQVPEEPKVEEEDSNQALTIAAVVGASMVDAINPCAFAVLIILMMTITKAGSRGKALRSGLAFALSIFISYLLMGLGLYGAISVAGLSLLFLRVVGWLAIIIGILNIKDYFWYGKGMLMEVPMSWRPKLKSLIKSVTSPAGAFGIGFLVSLFLLPCTSGPYIVILGMLSDKATQLQAVAYLVLYNLIFVAPMVLITLAVYKGYDPQKAEDKRQENLRRLHLIAGIIMLVMGSAILLGWW
ncbi:cytochrome c biogenesis protein [Patescibacteria group bacterium]